ncbi:MAG: acyltransferase [Lachnospiraceae bacterium]|nr:acyltransferase [Lachnospiraceae bacterium]
MEQNRVEWLDVARGIGLLLVIIGHTMTTPIRQASELANCIYTAIYFFHMPFMFYLSGRTFGMFWERNKTLANSKWIKKKWCTLMVPYFTYGVIVYFIFSVGNRIQGIDAILENAGYGRLGVTDWIFGVLWGDNLYAYHLWFIYALFLMNLVSFFMSKYIKKHQWILLVLGLILADARTYVDTTYWGIFNLFMKCYLWFIIGTYFDFSKVVKKTWAIFWQMISVLYLICYTGNRNGFFTKLDNQILEPVKWVMDVGMIMALIQISMLLSGALRKFFSYTGQNSYGIYLFHQPFFASGSGLVLYKVLGLPLPIAILITFLLCYVVPLVMINLLNKRGLQFLKPYLLGEIKRKKE